MKTLYAVALSTADKNAGIRVPPHWSSIPPPCWTPPRLEANIRDNVRSTDLVACAAFVARESGEYRKREQHSTAMSVVRAAMEYTEQELRDLQGLTGRKKLNDEKRISHNREARQQGYHVLAPLYGGGKKQPPSL
eukprot:1730831-Pyramimonas_sp.AAC.1